MKIKFLFSFILLGALAFLSGCCSIFHVDCPPDKIGNWFEAQQSLATDLNKYMGGTNWQIGALTGGIYPLGTTFYGPVPNSDCQFPTNIIYTIPLTPWPEITNGTAFNLSATLPAKWAAAIGLTLSANAAHTNVFYMKYSNLAQQFVYDDAFKNELANQTCHNSLVGGQTFSIIRGQIIGTLEVSSSSTFSIGGSITVTNIAGLTGQYSSDNGFLILETNAIAWFGIYSDVTVNAQPTGAVTNFVSSGSAPGLDSLNHQQSGTLVNSANTSRINDVGLMDAQLSPNANLTPGNYQITAPSINEAKALGAVPGPNDGLR